MLLRLPFSIARNYPFTLSFNCKVSSELLLAFAFEGSDGYRVVHDNLVFLTAFDDEVVHRRVNVLCGLHFLRSPKALSESKRRKKEQGRHGPKGYPPHY